METRNRAGKYLLEIMEMEENRWPKISLKEGLRGISNENPSKSEEKLEKAFRQVGDRETSVWI